MDTPIEIISSDAVGAIERSQIDMQVATARKYPRSIEAFLNDAKSMISVNLETAEGCNYRLKRKEKDGSLKVIEGPSIRLLEIAASAYTNLRYGSRIIGLDKEFVTAQGVASDMQKNVHVTVEVKRSIMTKTGQRYGTDMIMVTANAAGSIARRNALNGVVPRAYVMELAAYAKALALGDAKSLPERLQRAFDYFTKTVGVDQAKVLAYLEKPSIADCTLADLDELQGLKTMLKEGEISLETAFPDPAKEKAEAAAKGPDLAGPAKTPPADPPAPSKPGRTRAPKPTVVVSLEPSVSADAVTVAEMALDIDRRLTDEGVELEQFFDWLAASGRAHTFRYNPASMDRIDQLPEAQLRKLMFDPEELRDCIKKFGKKT